MKPYLKRFTTNLIAKNHLDSVFLRTDPDEFLTHTRDTLLAGDVLKMNAKTLGHMLCSIEIGDIWATKEELLSGAIFSGKGEDLLRSLVAQSLAYVIHGLLSKKYPPAYQRTHNVANEVA